jgi:hypothetical protein
MPCRPSSRDLSALEPPALLLACTSAASDGHVQGMPAEFGAKDGTGTSRRLFRYGELEL